MSSSDHTNTDHTWRQREAHLEAFEAACQRGAPPELAPFFQDSGGDANLLRELVHLDLEYRLKAGEAVRIEGYCQRFPELASDKAALVELLKVEFRLRRKHDAELSWAEYPERFPEHRDALRRLVLSETTCAELKTTPWSHKSRPGSEAPTEVPGYEIIAELGRGGMGVVYGAWQPKLRRQVALKMIPAGRQASQAELSRFRTEAEAVARLQHPGIVQIYDIGDHAGQPYFAMELVGGGSLANRLKKDTLNPRAAAELVVQLARAMHHAHERGIVHRDLNPANVLLSESAGAWERERADDKKPRRAPTLPPSHAFTPKIADFGLAKLLVGGDRTQTAAGDLLGTPSYMAPEQAEGKHQLVGPRTDVYGLGAILYACLTGQPPFRGPTPFDTIQLVLHGTPRPPSSLCPQCPRDLETICLKCLCKEPHQRYGSAEDLANDLERFLHRRPITARPVTGSERFVMWMRRNPTFTATLAAASALVVIIASIGLWRVLEERARFAAERDRAEAQLFRASLSDAKAQMTARDSGWWWQARDALRQAAGLPEAKRDPDTLHELACKFLGSEFPAYRVSHEWPAQDAPVWRMACSPDGKLLATAGRDAALRVWQIPDGRLLAELKRPGREQVVRSLVFVDNQRLATGCDDGVIRIWRMSAASGPEGSPSIVQTIEPGAGIVRVLLWWPQEATLIAGMEDGSIRLLPLDMSKESRTLEGHTSYITCLALGEDGARLVSGSDDKTIRWWDLKTSKMLAQNDHGKVSSHIAVTSDGGSAVVTNPEYYGMLHLAFRSDGTIHVGNQYGQPHTNGLTQLLFHRESGWVSASGDGSVRFWRSYTAAQLHEIAVVRGEFGPVFAALTTEDRRLVTAYQDGRIRVWERSPPPVTGLYTSVTSVAFVGRTRKQFNYIQLADLTEGLAGHSLHFHGKVGAHGHRNLVWAVAASPDGRWLASCDGDGVVKLWDAQSHQLVHEWQHLGLAWSVAFSPDSRSLASGAGDVKVWDVQSGKELHSFDLPPRPPLERSVVRSLAYHPHKPWLAVAHDGAIHLCDLATGKKLPALHQYDREVLGLAIEPRGKWLVAALADGGVALWPMTDALPEPGPPQRYLTGHPSSAWALAYRADGRILATGSAPGRVILWDGVTFEPLSTLQLGRGEVRSLAFSHDGELLAAGVHLDSNFTWDLKQLRSRLVELGIPPRIEGLKE